MSATTLLVVIFGLGIFSYFFGWQRSIRVAAGKGGKRKLHSLPKYYGYMTALWCGIPALLLLGLWLAFEPSIIKSMLIDKLPAEYSSLPRSELSLVINDLQLITASGRLETEIDPVKKAAVTDLINLQNNSRNLRNSLILILALAGTVFGLSRIHIETRARVFVERIIHYTLILCSLVAILTTIGIVLSVLFESLRFFKSVPITDFVFGTTWSPQTAIRVDQVGSSGAFGAIPLFTGTLLISGIALIIAVPVGLMTAIYLSEYASRKFRSIAKPLLEILAGVPTVVYGFFAALTVAPFIRNLGESVGLNVASESALAAGIVMGIMIIPFVSSLSDDVISAVPQAMRDGAYGMGATQSETIRQVLIPAALPGIVGGILLAASRAIGETMIVVMAAGLAANLTANPLQAVTTVTVQIVTLLTGDQEFDSPKTLAAFALGLMLFIVTLILNVIALHVVRKYREQYE